jgi:hypothetical protein
MATTALDVLVIESHPGAADHAVATLDVTYRSTA